MLDRYLLVSPYQGVCKWGISKTMAFNTGLFLDDLEWSRGTNFCKTFQWSCHLMYSNVVTIINHLLGISMGKPVNQSKIWLVQCFMCFTLPEKPGPRRQQATAPPRRPRHHLSRMALQGLMRLPQHVLWAHQPWSCGDWLWRTGGLKLTPIEVTWDFEWKLCFSRKARRNGDLTQQTACSLI